jgi:Raf kinase inhibitor-like YbhB/YbcL family protein
MAMARSAVWIAALFASALGPSAAHAQSLTLTSPDIKEGGTIANEQLLKGFGCTGDNISPALSWSGAPAGTKSFAVHMLDPDAPTGSGWWHWVVFNIPADVMSLPAGASDPAAGKLPKGAVQSRTDFGKPGYGGPCPPQGDKPHRYIFKVFALKTDKLDLDESASGALVGFMLNANKLGTAEFTATYGRK